MRIRFLVGAVGLLLAGLIAFGWFRGYGDVEMHTWVPPQSAGSRELGIEESARELLQLTNPEQEAESREGGSELRQRVAVDGDPNFGSAVPKGAIVGRLIHPDGPIVGKARVVAFSKKESIRGLADEQGRFAFETAPEGPYRVAAHLRCSKFDHIGWLAQSEELNGPRTELELVLTGGFEQSIRVLGSTGQSVKKFKLKLRRSGPPRLPKSFGLIGREGQLVAKLLPGPFKVEARADGFVPRTLASEGPDADEPLVFELAAYGQIEGLVQSSTGEPMPGARPCRPLAGLSGRGG